MQPNQIHMFELVMKRTKTRFNVVCKIQHRFPLLMLTLVVPSVLLKIWASSLKQIHLIFAQIAIFFFYQYQNLAWNVGWRHIWNLFRLPYANTLMIMVLDKIQILIFILEFSEPTMRFFISIYCLKLFQPNQYLPRSDFNYHF